MYFIQKNKFKVPIILLFIFFAAVDISSIFLNRIFYLRLFSTFQVIDGIYKSSVFPIYLLSYLTTVFLVSIFFVVVLNLLNTTVRETRWFAVLIGASGILFIFAKYPQFFYPWAGSDRIYQYLPSPFGAILFSICALILIGYSGKLYFRQRSTKAFFGFLLLALWFLERSFNLFSVQIDLKEARVSTLSQPIIVISVDSLNADSIDLINTYANSSLKEYLKNAIQFHVVADTTQTHGSFSSIFSGKQQFELKGRYPLSAQFSTDKQSELELLKRLKASGYRTLFLRDEMDTSKMESGPAIDELYLNYADDRFVSFLARSFNSFHLFAFSPDFLLQSIFPWLHGNAIQSYGYSPTNFSKRIVSVIKENKTPIFLFAHTCILHQPLRLPFGYLPDKVAPEDGGEAVSYNSFFNISSNTYDYRHTRERHKYDRELYNLGIRYVVEKFLNPTFREFEEMQLLSRAQIILVSDHGEMFWNQHDNLPRRNNFVFHGDSDLYGSLAQLPLFIVNTKSDTLKELKEKKQALNLSQAFKAALGFEFSTEIYSENAFPLLPEPQDLLTPYGYKELLDSIVIKGKIAAVDDAFEKPTVLLKQKTVFQEDLKLTLIRTVHGRNLVLCRYREDLSCRFNLWNKAEERDKVLLQKLQQKLQFDVDRGLDVSLSLNPDLSVNQAEEVATHLKNSNKWLNAYGAIIALNLFDDEKPLVDLRNGLDPHHDKLLSDFINKREIQTKSSNLDELAEKYNSLDTLPRFIYSYEVNEILRKFAPQVTQLTEIHNFVEPKNLDQVLSDLRQNLEELYFYSIEHKFLISEAQYWLLNYLVAKNDHTEVVVIDKLLSRLAQESQEKTLEKAVIGRLREIDFNKMPTACEKIRKISDRLKSQKNIVRYLEWKGLFQTKCR